MTVLPAKITSQALLIGVIVVGIPRAAAKALAVPLGIIPNGMLVLINSPATAEMVPSPPEAMMMSG